MIYIENENLNPALNHAIELYLMENCDDDVFMLWQNKPCVLIGRFQNMELEVDLDYARANDIDTVRRLSGGGAIYCDTDNMQYSFITSGDDIAGSFAKFAKPVVSALKSLGLNAEFTGRNDIHIDGAKISGNAQFRSRGKILHHGTLLFKANIEHLTKVLKARDIKFKGKAVQSIRSRIGFIGDYTDMDVKEFMSYVTEFIKREYDISSTTSLNDEQMQKIYAIKELIFDSEEWNMGNTTLIKNRHAEKYPCGIVEIGLKKSGDIICELTIEGDFFSERGVERLCELLKGTRCSAEAIRSKLRNVDIDRYIKSMDKETLVNDIVKLI